MGWHRAWAQPEELVERDIALTFAGGGNRAFYALGLLERFGAELLPRVGAIAGCSAGACIAAIWCAGVTESAADFWHRRRIDVDRNFMWSELFHGRRPMPHAAIYRDTLLHAFSGEGLARLRALPFPLYVVAAGVPRRVPVLLSMLLGFAGYSIEKQLRPTALHPRLGRRIGFSPQAFDARECESAEDVADLILASSATPPFTPIGRFRGHTLLDGGMVDNVPAFAAETSPSIRRNVVFLTRPYPLPVTGVHGNRLYVAPRSPIPVSRWDYTSSERVIATQALGREEATLHAPALEAFLSQHSTASA